MKLYEIGLGSAAGVITVFLGLALFPFVLQGRTSPFAQLHSASLGAASPNDVYGKIAVYAKDDSSRTVSLVLEGDTQQVTLEELGAHIDEEKTAAALLASPFLSSSHGIVAVRPIYSIDDKQLHATIHTRFGHMLHLPQNASLRVGASGVGLALQSSSPGQRVDTITLAETLREGAESNKPIELSIISAGADIQDTEVESARAFAQALLTNGFSLTFEDTTIEIKPFSIRRMLTFVPVEDPSNPSNVILGVAFDEAQLGAYLENTIAPEIDRTAIDARFTVDSEADGTIGLPRVTQFAAAQRGQELDIEATIEHVADSLSLSQNTAPLAVAVTEPDVSNEEDMARLGIVELLAQGESDFKGSPPNRVHNIEVGAEKYNGILIAPGSEFSFLQYLGPVTAEAGFKPELVIKNNVTLPEYGGGLCQVSTTAFRAALYSGLEITQRRNHSYAVSYYGTPGFDATIYPPYTDLRFLNNTPGYILVQTKIVGTKLLFDFWGTKDGREVEVVGPSPYNRQPDGAVKATLTQVVSKDGAPIIEDTFYSNYKSPKLFPKVLAANGEASVSSPQVQSTPLPNATPATTATSTPPKN